MDRFLIRRSSTSEGNNNVKPSGSRGSSSSKLFLESNAAECLTQDCIQWANDDDEKLTGDNSQSLHDLQNLFRSPTPKKKNSNNVILPSSTPPSSFNKASRRIGDREGDVAEKSTLFDMDEEEQDDKEPQSDQENTPQYQTQPPLPSSTYGHEKNYDSPSAEKTIGRRCKGTKKDVEKEVDGIFALIERDELTSDPSCSTANLEYQKNRSSGLLSSSNKNSIDNENTGVAGGGLQIAGSRNRKRRKMVEEKRRLCQNKQNRAMDDTSDDPLKAKKLGRIRKNGKVGHGLHKIKKITTIHTSSSRQLNSFEQNLNKSNVLNQENASYFESLLNELDGRENIDSTGKNRTNERVVEQIKNGKDDLTASLPNGVTKSSISSCYSSELKYHSQYGANKEITNRSVSKIIPYSQPNSSSTFTLDNTNISSTSKNCDLKKTDDDYEDLFSGIEFNDEIFAAIDATVKSKTNNNSNLPKNVVGSNKVQLLNCTDHQLNTTNMMSEDKADTKLKKVHKVGYAIPNLNDKQKHVGNKDIDIEDYGDFSVVDFDEMDKLIAQRQSSQSQTTQQVNPNELRPRIISPMKTGEPSYINFSRYVIRSVMENIEMYTKILDVSQWTIENHESLNTYDKTSIDVKDVDGQIYLQGEWFHTKCEVDDIIHICSLSGQFGTDASSLPITLRTGQDNDSEDDLVMIIHPDMLLTPSVISEAVTCVRRAVLKNRMGSSGLSSRAAIVGTMRHELFEQCLLRQNFSYEFARNYAPLIVRKHAETLIGCKIYNEGEIISEVIKVIPQIQKFASQFTSFDKNIEAGSPSILEGNQSESSIRFTADRMYATEEASVSPELGLKGFVDATVEAVTRHIQVNSGDMTQCNTINNTPLRSLMGVELKTGHNQTTQHNHTAQLALYTLMLRSRHGSVDTKENNVDKDYELLGTNGAANGGMLLYLNDKSFKAVHVSPTKNEMKSLLNHRNMLATETRRALKHSVIKIEYEDDSNGECERESQNLIPSSATLPDVLFSSHSCERCYSNRECMLYAKAEIQLRRTSGHYNVANTHENLLKHFTEHLTETDLEYFRKWDMLIDLESKSSNQEINKSWLVNPVKREKQTGKCISHLEVEDRTLKGERHLCYEDLETTLVDVSFKRSDCALTKTHLHHLKVEVGNRIVISSNSSIFNQGNGINDIEYDRNVKVKMNIVRGIVLRINENSIIVQMNDSDVKQLDNFIKVQSQKIQKSKAEKTTPWNFFSKEGRILFRLDKDEFVTGSGILRQNIVNFLTAHVTEFKPPNKINKFSQDNHSTSNLILEKRLSWLRRSIISFDTPSFDPKLAQGLFAKPGGTKVLSNVAGCHLGALEKEYLLFNTDQKAAVSKVLSAKDYTLIQGFPGTGKSSVLAFIVRLLVARGKRVLVTSYTHAAVDNLIIKLKESGVGCTPTNSTNQSDLVRIGHKGACHVNVHDLLISHLAKLQSPHQTKHKNPSVKSLHRVISSAKIVGVSTLSIPKSPLLSNQHFDVVIIDEAGQINQPAILGALVVADSFVLVGDHEQLPPLVQSDAAERAGYGESLLKLLATKCPSAVAQLTIQYRMHEDICTLSNKIVYKGKLKCANDDVKKSKLDLANFPRALFQMKTNPNNMGAGW
eukprot:CAMPEP_0184867600 /NCGR_PEP_ID=MMETSP0580-20130426/27217_1 /TAXON_ID=1118495 /ORGANISM="Dactyliosolen fragilissimus" /LENGTH=1622 /DNA_ID=CAMNT_0027367987 /DNA_START=91 /DNA_END=4956 /DNA_ORIENTATION=+